MFFYFNCSLTGGDVVDSLHSKPKSPQTIATSPKSGIAGDIEPQQQLVTSSTAGDTANNSASCPGVPCDCYNDDKLYQHVVVQNDDESATFSKCKEEFKRQMNFTGMIYRLEKLIEIFLLIKIRLFIDL